MQRTAPSPTPSTKQFGAATVMMRLPRGPGRAIEGPGVTAQGQGEEITDAPGSDKKPFRRLVCLFSRFETWSKLCGGTAQGVAGLRAPLRRKRRGI